MPPAKISKSGLPSRRGPDFAPRETPDGSASGAMLPGPKQVTKQVLPLPEYAPQPLTGPLAAAAEFDPPKWAVKNMYRLKGDALCVHASIRSLHAMVDETPDEDKALVVAGWVKPDGSSIPSAEAIFDAAQDLLRSKHGTQPHARQPEKLAEGSQEDEPLASRKRSRT